MVTSTDQRDLLSALTDCVVEMSRIRAGGPDEWLARAADVIRVHLVPRQVVSLWDGAAVNGARWSSVHLGVSAAQPESTERWNRQFMETLAEAGITPAVVTQSAQTPISGRLTRNRYQNDDERRTIESYWKRLGVESLEYFGGPLPPEAKLNGGGRTFFLSVWSQDRVTADDATRRALLSQAWRAAERLYLDATRSNGRSASLASRLTPGQARVAELLGQGLSKREIAGMLQRSEHTIHDHTKSIYSALQVNTRAEFMALWAGTRPS